MVVPAGTAPETWPVPSRDDGMVPYTPPESMNTEVVWRGPLLIRTSTGAIGAPVTEMLLGSGLGPNSSTPWDSLMSTPLLSRPGNAGITVLVPGNPLFGPIPKTPSTPAAAKYCWKAASDPALTTLTPVGRVTMPFPKFTVVEYEV